MRCLPDFRGHSHCTTVRGVTRMRGFCYPDQNRLSASQNNRCMAENRRRGRLANRIKAMYRGWGIAWAGTQVYAPRYREEWLQKIEQAGVRR